MLSAGKGKVPICTVNIPPMASPGIQGLVPKVGTLPGTAVLCFFSLCWFPATRESGRSLSHWGHICPSMTPKAQVSVWGTLIGRLAISLCCGHSRHSVPWCEGSNCPNHSPVTDSSWASSGCPEVMVILAVSKAGFPRGRILFVSVPSETVLWSPCWFDELVDLPALISFLQLN